MEALPFRHAMDSNTDGFDGNVLADYLKNGKAAFFEALASKEPCDVRLVVGPDGGADIDGVCCTVGAAYQQLLELRATGRASVISVPVLRLRRGSFLDSPLEQWLAGRGLVADALLFSDDAEEVLQLLARDADISPHSVITETANSGECRRVERADAVTMDATVAGLERTCNISSGSSCFCYAVLERLLGHASELVPAGRSRLFVTGPAGEDLIFLEVLRLLRDAVLDTTMKSPEQVDAEASSDLMNALKAVLG